MKKETKKHSTENLVNHLTEIEKEINEIFELYDEDILVMNFDLEYFLYKIQDYKKELKKIKNFKIEEY